MNVVFTATFLLVLYLKFTQPDIYADLVRVMPAVLDTYVSQLPPWAGDAIDSLLDIVKKCCSGCRFICSQLSVCKLQRSAGICQSTIIRNRGNPVFFLSLITTDNTTDKKVNSNSKSASGTEYFHRPYFYSFYLCIKKNERRKTMYAYYFLFCPISMGAIPDCSVNAAVKN